jgi:hypothetical protein
MSGESAEGTTLEAVIGNRSVSSSVIETSACSSGEFISVNIIVARLYQC